jgi:hypothetical protein
MRRFYSSAMTSPLMRQQHVVPLSRQAIEILREIEPLTGKGKFVFPSPRSEKRPLSDNALLAALRRMGFEQGSVTVHGFRSTVAAGRDQIGSCGIRIAHAAAIPSVFQLRVEHVQAVARFSTSLLPPAPRRSGPSRATDRNRAEVRRRTAGHRIAAYLPIFAGIPLPQIDRLPRLNTPADSIIRAAGVKLALLVLLK